MKVNITVILAFLLLAVGVNAQWIKKDFPVKTNLLDVEFADENVGYVITYSDSLKGIVYKTTDGGTNWFHSYSGSFHPQRLQVINDSVIMFNDDSGNIYKSKDGGKNWFQFQLANQKIHFSFVNEVVGWVASYINNTFSIIKTIDGGLNWQTIRTTSSDLYLKDVTDICFTDELHGWICGIDYVYRTEDGGNNWKYYGLTGWIKTSAISFLNNKWGWITGNSAYIDRYPTVIETTDGGATWNNSNLHPENLYTEKYDYNFRQEKVFRVEPLDSANLFLPGYSQENDGMIYKNLYPPNQITTFWITEQTQDTKPWLIKEQIYDVEVINKNKIIAVGTNGTYLQRSSSKSLSIVYPNGNEKIYPKNIIPISWRECNVLSEKLDLYYSDNAGAVWNLIGENIPVLQGVFNWRAPVISSKSSTIKIVQKSNNLEDINDSPFEIVNEERKIKIEYPLCGDTITSESDIKIKWSSNYDSSGKVNISFLYNNKYFTSPTLQADFNSGELTWHTLGSEMRVEITITDENSPEIVDYVTNVYITDKPQLRIILPYGGERWQLNRNCKVKILASNIINFAIYLSTDNGVTWNYLDKGIYSYNSDYYTNGLDVQVPNTLSNKCRIKVASTKDKNIYDINDSTFTITDATSLGYYPLALGNKWFYKYITSYGFNGVYKMLMIAKDTIIDQIKMYQIDEYTSENNHFYRTTKAFRFYYQEDNYIYEYPSPYGSKPIKAFRMIDFAAASKTTNIFGKKLLRFSGGGAITPFSFQRFFVDSIGFSQYSSQGKPYWNDLNELDLVGCIINNNKYGEVFEAIPVNINDDVKSIPSEFSLSQNYPNPFNPSTTIRYQIPVVDALSGAEVLVSLKVFDLLGREVATLVDEYKQPGSYQVNFNAGHVEQSRDIPSGIYFYRMHAGSFSQTKKFVLMK